MFQTAKKLALAYVNPFASKQEPVQADFIWNFSGLPKLWLADSFTPPEVTENGFKGYFETDLLPLFTLKSIAVKKDEKVLWAAPVKLELILAALLSSKDSFQLCILDKDRKSLDHDELKKFLPEEKINQICWMAKKEINSTLFDKIILIHESEKGFPKALNPCLLRLRKQGQIVVQVGGEPSKKSLESLERSSILEPVPTDLPVGRSEDLGRFFQGEEWEWDPGFIGLYNK